MKFLNTSDYLKDLLSKIKTQNDFDFIFREFTLCIDNGIINTFNVNSDIHSLIDELAIAQDRGDSLENLKELFRRILFYLMKAECFIQF